MPQYFLNRKFLIDRITSKRTTRQSCKLRVPAVRHEFARKSMSCRFPKIYNNMPHEFKSNKLTAILDLDYIIECYSTQWKIVMFAKNNVYLRASLIPKI